MNSSRKGILTFFCGKMGAGKTTMSLQLSERENIVLISEDDWLSHIYPQEIQSFGDYLTFSRRLKPLVKKLVQDILCAGTHVIMDFPANTASQRQWFKQLCTEIGAHHEMVYIEASNDVCLNHLAKRRLTSPERANFDTEAVFRQVTQYFEAPQKLEQLNVRRIKV